MNVQFYIELSNSDANITFLGVLFLSSLEAINLINKLKLQTIFSTVKNDIFTLKYHTKKREYNF